MLSFSVSVSNISQHSTHARTHARSLSLPPSVTHWHTQARTWHARTYTQVRMHNFIVNRWRFFSWKTPPPKKNTITVVRSATDSLCRLGLIWRFPAADLFWCSKIWSLTYGCSTDCVKPFYWFSRSYGVFCLCLCMISVTVNMIIIHKQLKRKNNINKPDVYF